MRKNTARLLCTVMALFTLLSCASFTFPFNASAENAVLVIDYSKIQRGNVNNKIKATVSTVTDPEKGNVIKIAPVVDTEETGSVAIDGYSIGSLGIDLDIYKYVTVEYKYVSRDKDTEITQVLNLMKNGNVLSDNVSLQSRRPIVRDEWNVAMFDVGTGTAGKITGEKDGVLQQLHFYPFGQKVPPTAMLEDDYILIGKFTFTSEKPEGFDDAEPQIDPNAEYNVSFLPGNVSSFTGTLPASFTKKTGETFTLPAIGLACEGKEVRGWEYAGSQSVLSPGASFTMPASDVAFSVSWRDVVNGPDVIHIVYPEYFDGMVDKNDTAFTSRCECDGRSAIKFIPNPSAQSSGSIRADSWNLSRAKIDYRQYSTVIMLYKYVSDSPNTEAIPQINIMKRTNLTKAITLKAASPLQSGKLCAAVFDMSSVRNSIVPGADPFLIQMHVYPFGNTIRPASLSAEDEFYVTDLIFLKDKTSVAEYFPAFISGFPDNTFRPEGNITRAEACAIAARVDAGGDSLVPDSTENSFADVESTAWYAKYIAYCERKGLLVSFSGSFMPDKAITRAEFCELIYRLSFAGKTAEANVFTDVDASHPYYEIISAASSSGLINGFAEPDGTRSFRPDNHITRAEAVRLINNALSKECSTDAIFRSAQLFTYSDIRDHWAFADIVDASSTHVSYYDALGKEHWAICDGAVMIDDGDFEPDFAAGEAAKTAAEAELAQRIAEIRSTPDSYPAPTGTIYYVSPTGNDSNDGKSPSAAFRTAAKGFNTVKYGDALLFERGGEYRITSELKARDGVTYAAYGTGAKPILNGNTLGSGVGAEKWSLVPGTTNIWKFYKKTNDVGNIILNGGEKTAEKLLPLISGGVMLVDGKVFDKTSSFARDNSFIVVYGTLEADGADIRTVNSDLYMRCDAGNPGTLYSSIEFATKNHTINGGASNCLYDNLCILYSGNHGVGGLGGTTNVRFTNCEVGWIGGSAQKYSSGTMVRYGNGIEVYGSCNGYYIDNCYVYQCYDTGITHQISSGGASGCIEQNIGYTNNVIEKCIYNVEYFLGNPDTDEYIRIMKNVLIENNLLAYSGYGWGANPTRSAQIKGWADHYNRTENFIIRNNTFLSAKYNTWEVGAKQSSWVPVLSGNTYIIPYCNRFVLYGYGGSTQYTYDGNAASILRDVVHEDGAVLYYTQP